MTDQEANQVADAVYGKISGTFVEFMKNLEIGQKGIFTKIEDHEIRLNVKKEQIQLLEAKFKKQEQIIAEVAAIKPTLETIQKTIRWWTWWKVVILAVVIVIIFVCGSLLVHRIGLVTQIKPYKQSYDNTMTYDQQVKMLNAPTRGAKDAKNWTAFQRDSIIDENQKGILRTIERNKKK
jgi:hypothetical protein